MKTWTWILNEGFMKHDTEKEAIAWIRANKLGQEEIKTTDTGVDPDCAIYSDKEIENILNEK